MFNKCQLLVWFHFNTHFLRASSGLGILHYLVCDTGIILPRVHFAPCEGFVQKGTKQRAMGERTFITKYRILGLKFYKGSRV